MIINKKDTNNKNVLNVHFFLVEKGKEILFEEIEKKREIIQSKLFRDISPWIGIMVE